MVWEMLRSPQNVPDAGRLERGVPLWGIVAGVCACGWLALGHPGVETAASCRLLAVDVFAVVSLVGIHLGRGGRI